MLNQAWTFSVIAQIAFYAAIGMAIAAVVVLGTLHLRGGRDGHWP